MTNLTDRQPHGVREPETKIPARDAHEITFGAISLVLLAALHLVAWLMFPGAKWIAVGFLIGP